MDEMLHRELGCRDAFAMAAVGDFKPFAAAGLEAALYGVLAEQSLVPSERKRKALVKHLETLDARDGARQAFLLLADAGIPAMALSNGAKSATTELRARSNLSDLVQEIVSVDEVKLAKPRTEVYLHAAERADIEPAELALVAAPSLGHQWRCGCRPGYCVSRRGQALLANHGNTQSGGEYLAGTGSSTRGLLRKLDIACRRVSHKPF